MTATTITNSIVAPSRGSRTASPSERRRLGDWTLSSRKRAFDVVAVLMIAPLALLAILVAAVASAIVFRAQPFFVQQRRGLHGTTLRVVKIRSLPADFDSSVGKHHLDRSELPRFSKVLRASHVDELPQLWNVLRGEMSVVGPRPMIDEVLDRLPADVVAARLGARPGMTGIWQVSTMGDEPLELCPQLDAWYVTDATVAIDVQVMIWTVATALWRAARTPEALLAHFGAAGGSEASVGSIPATSTAATSDPVPSCTTISTPVLVRPTRCTRPAGDVSRTTPFTDDGTVQVLAPPPGRSQAVRTISTDGPGTRLPRVRRRVRYRGPRRSARCQRVVAMIQ